MEVLGTRAAHGPAGPGRRPPGRPGDPAVGVASGATDVALLLEPVGWLGEQGRLALESRDACLGVGELLAGGGDAALDLGQLLGKVGPSAGEP